MITIEEKVKNYLKKINLTEKEINSFFVLHKDGFNGPLKKELTKMNDAEFEEVINGMLAVFRLTEKAKNNEKDPLLGLMLFNMLENVMKTKG